MAPRRERAGIETGEPAGETATPGRIPAAELVPPPPEPRREAPPLRTGADADLAREALLWLEGPWRDAASKGEAAGYLALSSPDFKGLANDGKEPAVVGAEAWAKRRSPPLLGPAEVLLGAAEAMVPPGPEPRVTLRVHEASRGRGGCTELDRELTVVRMAGGGSEGGGFRIVTEVQMSSGPCRESEAGAVAGAHEMLRQALDRKDDRAIREMLSPSAWVRDHGIEALRFGPEEVRGEAAWVGEALRGTPSESDRTRVAGREGVVRSADGALAFAYVADGERWRLAGLLRGAAPTAAPAPAPETAPGAEAPR
jgi:hypothetical protein